MKEYCRVWNLVSLYLAIFDNMHGISYERTKGVLFFFFPMASTLSSFSGVTDPGKQAFPCFLFGVHRQCVQHPPMSGSWMSAGPRGLFFVSDEGWLVDPSDGYRCPLYLTTLVQLISRAVALLNRLCLHVKWQDPNLPSLNRAYHRIPTIILCTCYIGITGVMFQTKPKGRC